jgi:hypothetical protein
VTLIEAGKIAIIVAQSFTRAPHSASFRLLGSNDKIGDKSSQLPPSSAILARS